MAGGATESDISRGRERGVKSKLGEIRRVLGWPGKSMTRAQGRVGYRPDKYNRHKR